METSCSPLLTQPGLKFSSTSSSCDSLFRQSLLMVFPAADIADCLVQDFANFADECWGQVACKTTQWLAKAQSLVAFVNAKLYG